MQCQRPVLAQCQFSKCFHSTLPQLLQATEASCRQELYSDLTRAACTCWRRLCLGCSSCLAVLVATLSASVLAVRLFGVFEANLLPRMTYAYGNGDIAPLFYETVSSSSHAPTALRPENERPRYPSGTGPRGSQNQSGRNVKKGRSLPYPGIELRFSGCRVRSPVTTPAELLSSHFIHIWYKLVLYVLANLYFRLIV